MTDNLSGKKNVIITQNKIIKYSEISNLISEATDTLRPFKTNDVKVKTVFSWNENIKVTFLKKEVTVYIVLT